MPLACALLVAGCTRAADAPPSRIILILVDTLRRDHLPMYGGEARTPNIEALAARGTALEAFASFHQTTMSMGALFTGRTPSIETGDPTAPLDWLPSASCGMGRFATEYREGECLPPTVQTLPEAIRARGYHTVGITANPLLFDPAGFSRGFDRWEEVGTRKKRKPQRASVLRSWKYVNEKVRESLSDLPAAPLFLYVHYLDVHDWLYRGRTYPEAVAAMDEGIGDLLGVLEEKGLLEDAAIVLASDHGELLERDNVVESMPLHFGNPAFRDVIDVPLILVGADDLAIPDFIRSEDLHYMLRSLVRAPQPERARDLARDELFLSELTYQTYQRGRFKSLQRRDGGFVLLDLEQDPGETRDVSAQHPEIVAAHQRRVAELAQSLAATHPSAGPTRPSEDWLDRLRVLGYVE